MLKLCGTVLTKRKFLQVSDIGPSWSSCIPWIKIVVVKVRKYCQKIDKNEN